MAALVLGCVNELSEDEGVSKPKNEFRNVILIGWDGVQRNHLMELYAGGKMPNLKKLSEKGAIISINVTTGGNSTKPGWAEILTGYSYRKTGVYSNKRFQAIPEGYTILERLEKRFGDKNIETVMIAGKKNNMRSTPPTPARELEDGRQMLLDMARVNGITNRKFLEEVERLGKGKKDRIGVINKIMDAILEKTSNIYKRRAVTARLRRIRMAFEDRGGQPYYHTSRNIDRWVGDEYRNMTEIGELSLNTIEGYDGGRFFFFFHFMEPDYTGHRYGENSEEYTRDLILLDGWLGKIMEKLDDKGMDDTMIIVASDHGFSEGQTGHAFAAYTFMAANDPTIVRNGDRKDIAPTMLETYGIDPGKIKPEIEGKSLREGAGPAALERHPPTHSPNKQSKNKKKGY
ncbi:MAG: alkaline phosphatase family protein [Candidatus Altiarchaeota archaeon]